MTEKKTTIVGEPEILGNKETFKKTIITEKEETIQKTEILKFTQTGGSSDSVSSDIDPLKLFEERRNQRRNERAASGVPSNLKNTNDVTFPKTTSSVTKTVKFGDGESQKLSDFNHSNKINNSKGIEEAQTVKNSRMMGSPSKFGSCRDRSSSPTKMNKASTASSISSPTKLDQDTSSSEETSSPSRWSPVKDDIEYVFNTTVAEDEEKCELSSKDNKNNLEYTEDDWNVASEGNRKKRLKNLASKFHNYDEDEDERINARLLANAAISPSPDVLGRRNTSKIVDVDREIRSSCERQSRSPTKRSNRNDQSFVKSLKAQGFEESGSKSKLVYEFKNSPSSSYRSTSPTKMTPTERPVSPFKHNPHQFICPQKASPACATPSSISSGEKSASHSVHRSQSPHKTPVHRSQSPQKTPIYRPESPSKTPAYRSVSPTRMLDPKPNSPFTPHPLQFISPQKANALKAESVLADGPPKPQRVFPNSISDDSSSNLNNENAETKSWKTEKTLTINLKNQDAPQHAPPSPPRQEPQELKVTNTKDQTDTASRRSILEKRCMFEDASSASSPSKDSPDPAMLPLSQRKALFEKNRSVPKPIARFGESVTPAMLSKAYDTKTPSVVYNRPIPASEPAWKRRRDISPQKFSNTPMASSKRSPIKEDKGQDDDSKVIGIHQRFEKSRRLFENVKNDWRESDIAKLSSDAKKNDMDVLMNRFKKQREQEQPEKEIENNEKETLLNENIGSPEYPGVNSLKRIKVSPPKPGQLYPDLNDIYTSDSASDMDRPETAMSDESCAPSEAPSLGSAIKRAASSHRLSHMPSISEHGSTDVQNKSTMNSSALSESMTEDDQINDMLDEALDVSPRRSPQRSNTSGLENRRRVSCESFDDGSTPPKAARMDNMHSSSPSSSASAKSWEYQSTNTSDKTHDFKTPRIEHIRNSPIRDHLPSVETEDGGATPASDLIHTVSFYRKQRGPNVTVTPHAKIARKVIPSISEEDEDEQNGVEKDDLEEKINKLQKEIDEQMQRRMQTSKALEICASKNEFEGSYERVEFERLLLEAHHKYAAATTEMNRLKTEGARRMSASGRKEVMKKSSTKGAISISGICLPLKADFIRLITSMPDQDTVHYFLCLVKYRSQVIATQMLSTLDGISARKNKLVFTNLINVNELEFDFQIYLEVYGLQTPRERLSHEAKYHIRKEKSMFNLTPLKKLKKQELRHPGHGRENPVNSLTIRKSKFGLVGYTTITIDTLKNKSYRLQKVPPRSPLDDGLEMKLNVYSESRVSIIINCFQF